MTNEKNFWRSIVVIAALLAVFAIVIVGTASAKSLYVNKNIANSQISAYDIQPAPNYLVWQQTSIPTGYGGVGLAIDTDSAILFVTFENSGTLAIVDAQNLSTLGTVIAPGASNLAGIVVDQDNQKVYTVDRNTDKLYVYSWDATNTTLTHLSTQTLPGLYVTGAHSDGAHGIALDELNDKLYVCDVTNTVKIFNTADWSSAGNISVTQDAMGVAVDASNGFVYTGNAYGPYGSLGLLSKYDLNTNTETIINVATLPGGGAGDNVVGLAVDPATSLLYITTGDQGVGGSDRIIVFDSNLTMLNCTGDIGDPTGLVVPGKEISYNPLNISKDDGLGGACVYPGDNITYTISYTNTNTYNVTGVTISDTLPPEVTFVSCTGGGSHSGSTVTWNIGTLTAGASGSVTLTVQVNLGTPPGTNITNYATINGAEPGTGPTTVSETTTTCLNQPPVANAGPDQTLEQTSHQGANVTLNGSGSYDPDGDTLAYNWTWTGGSATGVSPTVVLPLGTTTVTLTVSDGLLTDTDTVDITVVDTTPPNISVTVSPDMLWPPNHQMVDILATVTVSDICDAAPSVVLTSITCDEPDNTKGKPFDSADPTSGDGNTTDDIQGAEIGTEDYAFQLRAERAGAGDGRVYTITYTVTDASGNTASASATVVVPHNQG